MSANRVRSTIRSISSPAPREPDRHDVREEGTSRVTWEIERVGDSCRLTVIHDQLREGANEQLYGGWPMVLSGLKTLLETGEMLTTPASLMYLKGSASAGEVGESSRDLMERLP